MIISKVFINNLRVTRGPQLDLGDLSTLVLDIVGQYVCRGWELPDTR